MQAHTPCKQVVMDAREMDMKADEAEIDEIIKRIEEAEKNLKKDKPPPHSAQHAANMLKGGFPKEIPDHLKDYYGTGGH